MKCPYCGSSDTWYIGLDDGGGDYGEVCGKLPRGWRRAVFTVRHVHHLKITNRPWQQFKRWAWQRCAACGGKSRRWMPVNVSGSWSAGPQQAFRSKPNIYHHQCSALDSWRRNCEFTDRAIAEFGITRLHLEERGWSWGDAYQATRRAENIAATKVNGN